MPTRGTASIAEVRDKVFDPFFSTKGPTKGTGLGLSICYSIIKDHGGTIEIDSEKDKGTQFTIRIPVEVKSPCKSNFRRQVA